MVIGKPQTSKPAIPSTSLREADTGYITHLRVQVPTLGPKGRLGQSLVGVFVQRLPGQVHVKAFGRGRVWKRIRGGYDLRKPKDAGEIQRPKAEANQFLSKGSTPIPSPWGKQALSLAPQDHGLDYRRQMTRTNKRPSLQKQTLSTGLGQGAASHVTHLSLQAHLKNRE